MKKMVILALLIFTFAANADSRKNMKWSLVDPSPQSYKEFVKSLRIDQKELKKIYSNPKKTPKNAFITALAYDYGYAQENLDSLYQKAVDADLWLGDKYSLFEYADYLIRTDRATNILDYLSPQDCFLLKNYAKCLYYYGVARYFTDQKCNKYLNIAKNRGIKKGLIGRICR